MPTEADNVISHEEADNSNEKPAKKTEARRKKRMGEQGSQTDDETLSDGELHKHGSVGCATRSLKIYKASSTNYWYYLCFPKYKT